MLQDTPFIIAETPEGFTLMCGKYRISKTFETYEEAEKDGQTISWNRIVQVFGVMIEKSKELNFEE